MNWDELLAGLVEGLPIYWNPTDWIAFGLGSLATLVASLQVGPVMKRTGALAWMAKHGVPENKRGVEMRHRAPALPLLLLEAGHAFLKLLRLVLVLLFVLSFLASWYVMVFSLEELVAWVYTLNGQERRFLYPVQQSIADLERTFRLVAALQVLTLLPLVASALLRRFSEHMKARVEGFWNRPLIQFGHAALLIATILIGYWQIWPKVAGLIDTILLASSASVNWGSLLSQAVLSPLYAQAIFAGAGLIYLILYAVLLVVFLIQMLWKRLSAPREDTEHPLGALYRRSVMLREAIVGLCGGAALSFAVTIGAVMAGRSFADTPLQVQMGVTPQLLLWNAFFDGLTLTLTVWFIGLAKRWTRTESQLHDFSYWVAAEKVKRFGKDPEVLAGARVPALLNQLKSLPALLVVFGLDLIVAGSLAILAIWIGLGGGEWAVDLREAFRMLFGLSGDGTGFSFSSAFWVMHTTFIPSAAYIAILIYAMLFMLVWFSLGFLLKRVAPTPFLLALVMSLAAVAAKNIVDALIVPAISRTVEDGTYADAVNEAAALVPSIDAPERLDLRPEN